MDKPENGIARPSRLRVFEPVTDKNFFPAGYLLGNPDLTKAFGASNEEAAITHFQQLGHAEMRRQVTRDFAYNIVSQRAEKYNLFSDSINRSEISSLPAQIGNIRHSRNDYVFESANGYAAYFTDELLKNPDSKYADIGSGLRDWVYKNCIYVEVYSNITTDIVVEPNSELPFETSSLDGVGCFAVLEHVTEPWTTAKEFARVVKPGGKIFIDWPFLQPVHGYPSHYYNATRKGLEMLFQDNFEVIDLHTGVHQGPDHTATWIMSWLSAAITDESTREEFLNQTVRELCSHPPGDPFWQNVLTKMSESDISTLACGNTLVATRK
jgi:hypothetical protein